MEDNGITIFRILISFAAGILSFLSPCVLPLVPGYISLMSGVSIDNLKEGVSSRRAVIINSLAFNAGLSVIFLILGTTAGLVGAAITSNPWVRIIGGLVIIAFGLQLIGLLKISALYKDTRFFSDDKPRGMFGSAALGMAFAAGWTPGIGPILGGIIGLAATSGGWKNGLNLSAFYSAGLAPPVPLGGARASVPRRRARDELVPRLLLALPPPPAQGRGRLRHTAHRYRPDGRVQQPDVGRLLCRALPAERREPREAGVGIGRECEETDGRERWHQRRARARR